MNASLASDTSLSSMYGNLTKITDVDVRRVPNRTPLGFPQGRIRGARTRTSPIQNERTNYSERNKSSGTGLERMIVMSPHAIKQDTYLDNGLGDTLRAVKAKYGRAPFVEAYKRVMITSKKIDDEWEEYLAEEVRQRAFLEDGEDL